MSKFSDNLKKYRKSKHMTLEELADDVNRRYGTKMAKGTISRWENGSDTTSETIQVLSDYFGVTMEEMLGIHLDRDDVNTVDSLIPVLGNISAGTPLYAEQNIIAYTACPPFKKSVNRSLFYLRVRGDSMDREFPDGSDVLVDRDAQVDTGDIAVVLVNGDEATVKKIRYVENYIILIPLSNNTEHYARQYDLNYYEITIVGKVIGVFKRY